MFYHHQHNTNPNLYTFISTKLQSWLAHLVDIAPETMRSLVERIERNLEGVSGEAKLNFLDTQLDINRISDSLSAVGIIRADVLSPPARYTLDSTPLYITIVVLVDFGQYCGTEKVSRSKIVDWFCAILL